MLMDLSVIFRCICGCKDTNFLANHNNQQKKNLQKNDVYAVAKIRIFQLITTHRLRSCRVPGCICGCKDTNFLANHNCPSRYICSISDVYAVAKIRIFQLITTCTTLRSFARRCICGCKDTNFLANHNSYSLVECIVKDVYAVAKIRIFQLITTLMILQTEPLQMYMRLQRYEFFS